MREWVVNHNPLIIIVGGVLTDDLPKLGGKTVSVPKYYFKIIFDKKAVSFLLENKKNSGLLSGFVVSVDSIEQISGLDFFHFLPDSLENDMEKTADLSDWF